MSDLLRNTNVLSHAISRACAWLLAAQNSDGHWRDYDIRDQITLREAEPIGASDQWVTAYTGLALAEAGVVYGEPAVAGAVRAAEWLEGNRTYEAGWGFNGRTGPDVDSTTHAILLQWRLGRSLTPRDVRFLASGACSNGGFATYPAGPGEWGRAHADVTGPALMALPPAWRKQLQAPAAAFLRSARSAEGYWPCYWWKTPHYGTYYALRADRALDLGIDSPTLQLSTFEGPDEPSDAAFAAGIELHRHGAGPKVDRLVAQALDGQEGDGGWRGTASLRVPRQNDAVPWSNTFSPLYTDNHGIFTTAHIMRVMVRIAYAPLEFSEVPEPAQSAL